MFEQSAGLFLPSVVLVMCQVSKEIGIVVDPRQVKLLTGTVIALQNQPVVTPGEMVARVFFRGNSK